MEQEKKGLTAEEKEEQITKSIESVEGKPLTEEEEWNVLAGKGIEFKADKLTIIIPPIKISQFNKLHEIDKLLNSGQGDEKEKFDKALKALSEFLHVSVEDMGENLFVDDLFIIMRLLIYSYLNGRKLFNKSVIKKKEILDIKMKDLI